MDLDEYLWLNHITGVDFADTVKISGPTLRDIKYGRHSPKLVTALKILSATKGEIGIEELLNEVDAKDLKNWLDAN